MRVPVSTRRSRRPEALTIPIHKVEVTDDGCVRPGIEAATALEDLRVRPALTCQRLGLQQAVVELVEVAPEALLELAAEALSVFHPPLADAVELDLKPAA